MGRRKVNNPEERFHKLINASSTIPETREFRAQLRDVFQLGGVLGVAYWIEAREDLGLIVDPHTLKAAHEVAFVASTLVDLALTPPPKPAPVPYEERLRRMNAREQERRRREERTRHIRPGIGRPRKTAPRMEAAFDRMLMQLIRELQQEAA